MCSSLTTNPRVLLVLLPTLAHAVALTHNARLGLAKDEGHLLGQRVPLPAPERVCIKHSVLGTIRHDELIQPRLQYVRHDRLAVAEHGHKVVGGVGHLNAEAVRVSVRMLVYARASA